jgi:acyl-CoA synthetase (NDP forming)
MEIIKKAVKKRAGALSEHESKDVLSAYGVPVTREFLVKKMKDAVERAEEIGYPVVLKGSGRALLHKTEMDVIRLGLKNSKEVRAAFKEIKANGGKALEGILVQEMVKGQRELVIGLIRDAQFGPCVMFGLGGIYTEILRDVSFRVAPLEKRDALEMMEEIKGKKILDAFRGMDPADREALAEALVGLGKIGLEHEAVKEIDVNPLILTKDGRPVAVDALIVLEVKGSKKSG